MWNGIHAGRREKAEGRMKNAEMRRRERVDLGFFILPSAFFIALTVPLYAAMSKSPFPPRRNLCPQLKPARRGLNPPVAPNRVDAGERPPVRAGAPTPSRWLDSAGSLRQLAMRQPRTSRWPSCRTREKSRPCLMRIARPNFSLGSPAGMAHYTGVRRLRPWRRRLRNVARPPLVLLRARKPCCRTRRRLDG